MTLSSALSERSPAIGVAPSNVRWRTILWVIWIIALAADCIGVAQRVMYGHNLAGYGSYVPWGLWIGLYFLGVGIAGGAFVIGAVGYILGLPGFSTRSELRTAIVLSIAAIIPSFVGVWLDLGRMDRLPTVLIHPTFTSMMAFNAWMYNLFMLVAIVSWLLTFKERSIWLKPLLVLGAFFSILFPSQSGVFFEAVRTNPYWHGAILSVLFLASAIALGSVGLLLIRMVMGPESPGQPYQDEYDRGISNLRAVAVGAIIVYLGFEFAELSIEIWNPGPHSQSVDFLLYGDYWAVYWIFHLLLGAFVPLALFATTQRGLWAVAGLLAVVGFGLGRMCVLVPGQISGQIPGLQHAFEDIRLTYTYHPTLMEYLVGCLMLAVGMAIFYVGIRLSRALASRFQSSA